MATFPLRQKRAREARTSESVSRKAQCANESVARHTQLFDDIPKSGSRYLTLVQLLNRDGGNCYLCGDVLALSIQIDHIIARKHGGSDHPLNLALACKTCNARKRDLVVAFTIADRRPFFLLP